MKRELGTALLAGMCLGMITAAHAEESKQGKIPTVEAHLVKPERRMFDESLLKNLKVPDGFEVEVFAQDLQNPRMMAVAADGTVYVTRQEQNDVLALQDTDGDGRAEPPRTVASNLELVHGIDLHENRLYLASPTKVWAADLNADGLAGKPRLLIDDLPDGGQHRARTLAFGPDGMLYISVGSSCNDCAEANPNHATMQRAQADGSEGKVYARGLRHTIGFGWHPETQEMWGMDNGSDYKGDELPPEELNLIKQDRNYGWPICYGKQVADKMTVAEPKDIIQKEISKQDYCKTTEPAVLTYHEAHSAPIGMVFYDAGSFPDDYRGDAFIALRGSWNRAHPVGYKIARVRFEDGKPSGFDDFLTGFLINGAAHFGRPSGVAVTHDGALLISDDVNGVIYRVTYRTNAPAQASE